MKTTLWMKERRKEQQLNKELPSCIVMLLHTAILEAHEASATLANSISSKPRYRK